MLSILSMLSYVLVFLLLMALSYRDAKEYILPDALNAALAICFGAFHISLQWLLITPQEALIGALAGGGMLLLIRAIANKFYNPDSLGLGDVKLMTAAGFGLGYPNIFLALTIGAAAGLIHGFCIMGYQHLKNNHKIEFDHINVPAGVGLSIGIAATLLWQFGFAWSGLKG